MGEEGESETSADPSELCFPWRRPVESRDVTHNLILGEHGSVQTVLERHDPRGCDVDVLAEQVGLNVVLERQVVAVCGGDG